MVCQSVCPLVTAVYFGRTAEAVELPFGVMGRMGSKYRVLDRPRLAHAADESIQVGDVAFCQIHLLLM